MKKNGWIFVPGWVRFQHYHDRDPTWIKVYRDLTSRDEWLTLTLAERGLLVSIWLAYARANGVLSTSNLRASVGQRIFNRHLEGLSDAGFIRIRASKPLALARARGEKEKETPPTPPSRRRGGKGTGVVTGWRLVRGTHGFTHVRDPNGTDRPPPDATLKEVR